MEGALTGIPARLSGRTVIGMDRAHPAIGPPCVPRVRSATPGDDHMEATTTLPAAPMMNRSVRCPADVQALDSVSVRCSRRGRPFTASWTGGLARDHGGPDRVLPDSPSRVISCVRS